MSKPLEYYFANGTRIIFNKYVINENGTILNYKTGKPVGYRKNQSGYNICSVRGDDGKRYDIRVCRAIASTFLTPPPTHAHTADHIDRNPQNDTLENIRWLCKSGQTVNQSRSKGLKSAFVIVKDGIEKTLKEWVEYLKDDKNPFGHSYSIGSITRYTQNKQFGFSYKEYPDLLGEEWRKIVGSETTLGRWEISNMNRVKYITKYAENVISGDRFYMTSGYPSIVLGLCHILSYKTFFPEKYAMKKVGDIVLHEKDDKMDFRPHKLRLGTKNENGNEAHANGCYGDMKSARMSCASYVDDILEKEHVSQSDAVRYLRSNGYPKSTIGRISVALSAFRNGKIKIIYGRTWKIV